MFYYIFVSRTCWDAFWFTIYCNIAFKLSWRLNSDSMKTEKQNKKDNSKQSFFRALLIKRKTMDSCLPRTVQNDLPFFPQKSRKMHFQESRFQNLPVQPRYLPIKSTIKKIINYTPGIHWWKKKWCNLIIWCLVILCLCFIFLLFENSFFYLINWSMLIWLPGWWVSTSKLSQLVALPFCF